MWSVYIFKLSIKLQLCADTVSYLSLFIIYQSFMLRP